MTLATSTHDSLSDDLFALLDWLLSSARLRLRAEAKPIAFALPRETFLFDPLCDGPLFQRVGAAPAGVLVLHCEAALLQRLVTDDDFELRDDDEAWFDGRVEDLLVLADVLDEQKSALGIRAAASSSSRGGRR